MTNMNHPDGRTLPRHTPLLRLLSIIVLLSGCEQLGLETPLQANGRMEAEGKAIGSSCRQAGRALEDCYQINPKAPKAAIFSGWREMDAYMRENQIEEVKPLFPMKPPEPKKKKKPPLAEGALPEGAAGEGKEGLSPANPDAPAGKPPAGDAAPVPQH